MKVTVFEQDITDDGMVNGLADAFEEAAKWLRDEQKRQVITHSMDAKYHQIWNVQLGLVTDYDSDLGKATLQLFVHYDDNEMRRI